MPVEWRSRRGVAYLAVTAALIVAAAGGSALAAAGSSSSIHACASKTTGALRLAAKCKRTERAVTWSVAGPRGPQGKQGRQGPRGPAGSARAYGLVPVSCAVSQTCTLSASKNAKVTHPFTGVYCITVTGASTSNTGVIATLGFTVDPSPQVEYTNSGSCGGLEIVTTSNGVNMDEPFFFLVP